MCTYVCTRASVYAYAYAYAYAYVIWDMGYEQRARMEKGREEMYSRMSESRLSSLIHGKQTLSPKSLESRGGQRS